MDNGIIVNRVAQSGIITLDLATFYPPEPIKVFDLKGFLFMEMILREKEFRAALKELDWTQYNQSNVAITCSVDVIVPKWAYMLVAGYLAPIARRMVFGSEDTLRTLAFVEAIAQIDPNEYKGKRVVIKGCGDLPIPESAYVEITRRLQPVVKSLMYGEACSAVPIFKDKDTPKS